VNPFLQQRETQQFLRANRVQAEAWAPFAEGRNHIFENPTLRAVATKHNRSVAQVILRWLSQRGIVVLSKSVRKARMVENFNVLDFELSTDDIAAITTLDTGTSSFFDHRDPEKVKWLGTRELDVQVQRCTISPRGRRPKMTATECDSRRPRKRESTSSPWSRTLVINDPTRRGLRADR
jgi:hypothetical protein